MNKTIDRMRRIVFSLLLIIITSSLSVAQENYFYLGWNYNTPLSNTDWIGGGSGRGGTAGYRFFVRDSELSVGLDVSWTTFDEYKERQTFVEPGGAVTTDYFNYIYQYAAVVSAQYYLQTGDGERFFPYAGLGLGANYNRYTQYYNIYSEEDAKFGFLARPEIGILVRFSERRSIGAIAAIHYDYSTNRNEQYNYNSFSSAGFKLGIVLMNRY